MIEIIKAVTSSGGSSTASIPQYDDQDKPGAVAEDVWVKRTTGSITGDGGPISHTLLPFALLLAEIIESDEPAPSCPISHSLLHYGLTTTTCNEEELSTLKYELSYMTQQGTIIRVEMV